MSFYLLSEKSPEYFGNATAPAAVASPWERILRRRYYNTIAKRWGGSGGQARSPPQQVHYILLKTEGSHGNSTIPVILGSANLVTVMTCAAPEGTPPRRFRVSQHIGRHRTAPPCLGEALRREALTELHSVMIFKIRVRTIPVHARFSNAMHILAGLQRKSAPGTTATGPASLITSCRLPVLHWRWCTALGKPGQSTCFLFIKAQTGQDSAFAGKSMLKRLKPAYAIIRINARMNA